MREILSYMFAFRLRFGSLKICRSNGRALSEGFHALLPPFSCRSFRASLNFAEEGTVEFYSKYFAANPAVQKKEHVVLALNEVSLITKLQFPVSPLRRNNEGLPYLSKSGLALQPIRLHLSMTNL